MPGPTPVHDVQLSSKATCNPATLFLLSAHHSYLPTFYILGQIIQWAPDWHYTHTKFGICLMLHHKLSFVMLQYWQHQLSNTKPLHNYRAFALRLGEFRVCQSSAYRTQLPTTLSSMINQNVQPRHHHMWNL
jgi:hypothetical protein